LFKLAFCDIRRISRDWALRLEDCTTCQRLACLCSGVMVQRLHGQCVCDFQSAGTCRNSEGVRGRRQCTVLGRECTVPVVRVLWSLGGEASGGPSCFRVAGHSLGAGGECLVVCGGNGGKVWAWSWLRKGGIIGAWYDRFGVVRLWCRSSLESRRRLFNVRVGCLPVCVATAECGGGDGFGGGAGAAV
jgi:hypothetical protein